MLSSFLGHSVFLRTYRNMFGELLDVQGLLGHLVLEVLLASLHHLEAVHVRLQRLPLLLHEPEIGSEA